MAIGHFRKLRFRLKLSEIYSAHLWLISAFVNFGHFGLNQWQKGNLTNIAVT